MSSSRQSSRQILTPDTVAPETLQPICYWTITPLFVVTVVTTVIRIYIRSYIKSFGLDDWAAATLLPLNAGLQAILYIFLQLGAGLHITQVQTESPESLPKLLKAMLRQGLFVIEIYYVWMHFHLKLGFLLFYLRLSHLKSFRIVVYVTMACNGLLTVGIWLLYFLQCTPLEAFWNPMKYPKTHCLDTSITYFVPYSFVSSETPQQVHGRVLTAGGFKIMVLDVTILVLPIHTVWNLQMTLRRRLAVLGVICTGGAAVVISALRIMVLLQFSASPDFTWTLGKMIIVSAFEINIAIIASNMPSIKALWLNWRGGTLNSSQRSKYSQHHQLSDMPSSSLQSRRPNQNADNVSEESLVAKEALQGA
ncbi:uncharacterized protein BKCO1_6700011 [Diplodia corticola]|uniref:Integral membrane protein n=1 Tax=Diplodia corticola TaxID=236234 RepID=A0A1J9RNG8_9PEZI|nr:uncharacterized protein BKCO1_6700011 [Diplodia corticola]OJD30039.1 integral membrane protein [Diplodia corticola]